MWSTVFTTINHIQTVVMVLNGIKMELLGAYWMKIYLLRLQLYIVINLLQIYVTWASLMLLMMQYIR